jgi:hypothetical protein
MSGGIRFDPRWLLLLVLPVLITVVLVSLHTGRHGTPAAASAGPAAPAIKDLTCDPADHGEARIAVHLTIMIKGRVRDIPPSIGIAGALVAFPSTGPVVTRADCYYWIHTGRDDGVIHADPPAAARRSFTLSDFFDVWHQPLGTQAVGPDEGTVSSYVNGRRYRGNPRAIPLTEHAVIQLDVGRDAPPAPYTFPSGT